MRKGDLKRAGNRFLFRRRMKNPLKECSVFTEVINCSIELFLDDFELSVRSGRI